MQSSVLRLLVGVTVVAMGCSTRPAPDNAVEQELRDRFALFINAFQTADADVLAPMLTDDYVHTGPTGSVSNKTQWLNWIRSRRNELEAGTYRFDSYEIEDLTVRLLGDAAVITGLNKASGIRSGEPFAFQIQFTNVWTRQGGTWLRAAFHDSRVE